MTITGLALALGTAGGAGAAGGGAGVGMAAAISAEETTGSAFIVAANCAEVAGAKSIVRRAGSFPAAGSRSMRPTPTGPVRSKTRREVPGVNRPQRSALITPTPAGGRLVASLKSSCGKSRTTR